MNLPWYGWSRWTCFVRSRSGSSASDHERSRSRVAYSSSCVTATRTDSTRRLERLRDPLHAAFAHGDHVEPNGEPRELRLAAEPGCRRLSQPTLLLGRDHLERVAESRALLLLDFDEAQIASPSHDQVELVAAGPHVLAEDPPASQPVPPPRAPLGCVARPSPRQLPPRSRSRAPGSSAGARPTGLARGRPRSDRA